MNCRLEKLLSRIALSLVLPFLAQGQEHIPPTHWQEYSFPADGFAITFPYAPVPHPDRQYAGTTAYTIRLTQDIALTIRTKPADYCETELRQAIQRSDNTAKELSVAGHAAFESDHQQGQLGSYTRYWCGDRRFFIASMRWPWGQPKPAAAFRILNSFRVIPSSTR